MCSVPPPRPSEASSAVTSSRVAESAWTTLHTTPSLADWTPAISVDAVSTAPARVEVDDVPIIVIERDERILAVAATCPHRGAPLDEGTFDDTSVTCPWHGSRFALGTGALLRGPSAMPLACFETRVTNGMVEVRTPVR